MHKLMGCVFLLGLVAAAGCTDEVGDGKSHVECPPGTVLWLDDDNETEICAEVGPGGAGTPEIDWRSGTTDGPPPPPGPVSRNCSPTPTPVPDPIPPGPIPPGPIPPPTDPIPTDLTANARTAPAPAPACPPLQYKTVFKKFRGPLLVGGRTFGEHSATRMVLWEATWDAVQGRYTWKPIDNYETANHGPTPSNQDMKKYAEVSSPWTTADGVGKTAFTNLQNKYCPCDPNNGHQTSNDSCYGFRAPNHVCHSDTIYQEILFRGFTGIGGAPRNQCGTGLFGPGRYAP
jgi:hypothetical protein